jgi:hypothetical protein
MGIFRETNTIKWPAVAKVPRGDGSKKLDHETFNITVALLPVDERQAMFAKAPGKEATPEESQEFERFSLEVIVNNIEGWDLQNLEFNPANLEKVLNNAFYRVAIMNAFWAAQNGGEVKN